MSQLKQSLEDPDSVNLNSTRAQRLAIQSQYRLDKDSKMYLYVSPKEVNHLYQKPRKQPGNKSTNTTSSPAFSPKPMSPKGNSKSRIGGSRRRDASPHTLR